VTRLSSIASILKRQLEQHGYHLTDAEVRDVAAQVVMCIDEPAEPRTTPDREQMWRPTDGALW
jgi:hypothetical protein